MRSGAGSGGGVAAATRCARIQYFDGLEMKRYSVPILPQ
jgi:hypothetical protein